jgi:hypothetical protein
MPTGDQSANRSIADDTLKVKQRLSVKLPAGISTDEEFAVDR